MLELEVMDLKREKNSKIYMKPTEKKKRKKKPILKIIKNCKEKQKLNQKL